MDDMSNIEEIRGGEVEDDIDPYCQIVAEKMQIARNVVIQCELLHNLRNRFFSDDIQNIIRYTGVTEETVKTADSCLEVRKTFNDCLKQRELTDADSFCFAFASIRRVILALYTKVMQVATKEKLINGLLMKRWMRLRYDELKIKNNIYRLGFTWKRLPGTKRSILVERTDQSMKRMEYLTRMKTYREAGRSIVYADAHFYYCEIVVSPQHGLLHMGFHCRKEEEIFYETWVKNFLIDILPPNSVVVLKEGSMNETELPTPSAPKSDMVNWLDDHNVPHDPTLHKAELYSLIKKFKHLPDSDGNVYRVLQHYGHDVVFRPKYLKAVDFLEEMWSGDPLSRCKTKIVDLKEKTIADWQRVELIIVSREVAMYEEDILMEVAVDKLLTLAKYGELTSADLNECDEESSDDDYYSSIIYE